jgi:hypothetical protein
MDLPEAARNLNDFWLRQYLGFGFQRKKQKHPLRIQELWHLESSESRIADKSQYHYFSQLESNRKMDWDITRTEII